jgi:hypothetical protein
MRVSTKHHVSRGACESGACDYVVYESTISETHAAHDLGGSRIYAMGSADLTTKVN